MNISHSGLPPSAHDCSGGSSYETTVIAWYTGVSLSMEPITSGYRLALVYHLRHTTASPRPLLQTNTAKVQQLRNLMISWKPSEDKKADPEKIVALLSCKYSKASRRACALKRSDAPKVAILSALAKEVGLHLGLAAAVCTLSGQALEWRSPKPRHKFWRGIPRPRPLQVNGLEKRNAENKVEFEMISETKITIRDVVDVAGNTDSHSWIEIPCLKDEVIPGNFSDMARKTKHDGQELSYKEPPSLSRCKRLAHCH